MSRAKKYDMDLTQPAEARRFFREFRSADGKRIDFIQLANGMKMDVLLLNDELAMHYASELCKNLYQQGFGYFETEALH